MWKAASVKEAGAIERSTRDLILGVEGISVEWKDGEERGGKRNQIFSRNQRFYLSQCRSVAWTRA